MMGHLFTDFTRTDIRIIAGESIVDIRKQQGSIRSIDIKNSR
jgi:hypothetical protein